MTEEMLIDKTIAEFIDELKSEAPTPGGGGVAALDSALGTALIMMVANLTVTSDKYSEWHELCRAAIDECQVLLDVLKAGIDADAEEFGKVIDAYGMPRATEEEKETRSLAIAEASITAAEVPLKVMEASVRALEIDLGILGRSNPNLESDLYVGARDLQAGLLSAKYNVDANLGGIRKIRPELAEEYKSRSEELIKRSDQLVRAIIGE